MATQDEGSITLFQAQATLEMIIKPVPNLVLTDAVGPMVKLGILSLSCLPCLPSRVL